MKIEEIRVELLAWLKEHRAHCKDGTCYEPLNAIAFLAHCVGVRSDTAGQLVRCITEYERCCPGCEACEHN